MELNEILELTKISYNPYMLKRVMKYDVFDYENYSYKNVLREILLIV